MDLFHQYIRQLDVVPLARGMRREGKDVQTDNLRVLQTQLIRQGTAYSRNCKQLPFVDSEVQSRDFFSEIAKTT